MIHSTLRIALPAHKLNEALGILNPMTERIRVDPACVCCHVYQDAQEDCVLMLEEVWKTEKALDSHLRSTEYRNVLLIMEMAREPPKAYFRVVSRTAGFEVIERARR